MALKSRNKVKAEFNMSSMTDIIFLLLIFFVITSTVVREPVMKILLPKGVKKNIVKQVIKVYVDRDLNYAIDDKVIPYDRLPSELEAVLNNNPGATVSVHADKEIAYEKVMDVVMIADKKDAKVVLALNPE
jgi:biopolymer transport protein ExbD